MISENFARFSPGELAEAAAGEWLGGVVPEAPCGIFTDTRVSGAGRMFLALSGEKFDAHDFLDRAADAGAAALCVRRDRVDRVGGSLRGLPVLVVGDVQEAYWRIARHHRRRFPDLKLAAVTGSVGKTSVKEMLRAIFTAASGDDPDAVLYTLENTNNHVGVPQNLLRLNARCRYAVIEMGTNHFGEIAPLAACAEPDAALVNSIAPCHLEFFKDLEGVAREKSAIYSGLKKGGIAVLPARCAGRETLTAAAKDFFNLSFGEDCGELRMHYSGCSLCGGRFELGFSDGSNFEVEWPLPGRHQALNASAAAAAAFALGIEPRTIVRGLRATRLPGMRGKLTELDGVTFLNDAYNANPASMRASFELLAEAAAGRKLILALGEMRELGRECAAAHREVFEYASKLLPRAEIITVGGGFDNVGSARHFNSSGEAAATLSALLEPGAVVFVKGSRLTRMELALPEGVR